MACFTNGTMICTLKGEKPVEELSVGDRVVTRDNGLQTVRRISRREYDYGQLSVVKHLQPILVSAGALGKGLPERDMLLSPNQRLLVSGDSVSRAASRVDRLVAVKNLVDRHKVRECAVLGVHYVHIEFACHEVVLANGLWAESFHGEDAALGAEGNAQRTELHEIFPDLKPARTAKPKVDATPKMQKISGSQV